ncbi:uncharacterized protein LOC135490860 [Lineus longissimus]|uniref:uncharacterized protein LOC135490860 n=1 Tax=Lineus longissimus TaxID=88925 RepID=UPI002B4CF320
MWVRILALFVALSALCVITSAESGRLRRVFDETCWRVYKNKIVKKATIEKGIKNLDKCKTKCMGIENCVAVQWSQSKKQCAIHVGRKIPRWKRAKKVNQYLKGPCMNKVMNIELEDLTPGDGHHKQYFFVGFEKAEWFLDVQPNTMLFGKMTAFQKRNKHGKVVGKGKVKKNCLYIGTANGGEHEGGLAAVSTCDPSKTRVYIQTPIQDYEINPFRSYSEKKRSIKDPGELEKMRDMIMQSLSKAKGAPYADSEEHPVNIAKRENVQLDMNKQQPIPPGQVLYLDHSCIVDTSFSDFFKSVCPSDDDQMFLHIAELYNFAQIWFLNPTLGFQVWLTIGKVILMTDPMVKSPDESRRKQSYGLMNNCNYFKKVHKDSKYWDSLFILTESDFMTDGLGGLALGSGACRVGYQCAAVKSQNLDLAMLTRAIVHETAHLLGMPDVYPPAEASKFCYSGLMRSAQFAHDWSRCDNQAFEQYLYTRISKCITRKYARLSKKNRRPKFRSNVLWRYKAKQSSTSNGDEAMWGAWKAVDGSYASMMQTETKANPRLASCTKTKKQKDPWIRVQVLAAFQDKPIDTIHILNRPERYDRLKNIEVRIGNNADHNKNPLCYARKSSPRLRNEGSMLSIHCGKIMSGKYVSVQIKGKGALTVCEIFAYQTTKLPNFKSPYKCEDERGNCHTTKKLGHCRGDYKEISINTCALTCGYCNRKTWKYKPKPGKTGAAPKCGDNADYCDKVKSKGKCASRSSIQLCPKTCGECGKAKVPDED